MVERDVPVIPTPRHFERTDHGHKTYTRSRVYTIGLVGEATERLCFAGEFLKEKLRTQHGLHFNVVEGVGVGGEEDIVIHRDLALPEREECREFFGKENAREQGYLIEIGKGVPIVLQAPGESGCLYALSTLVQLFRPQGEEVRLDHALIEDCPDFRYRGVRWLIQAEIGVWAYDRGDGPDAFRQRIVEKLDMALAYKINAVIFDGFGWGTDAHPEGEENLAEMVKHVKAK